MDDNTSERLIGYKPWSVEESVLVQVEGPDGIPVIVGLPFIAARSAEALRVTGVIVASKAVRDFQEANVASRRQLQLDNLRKLLYEPPLQRFKCEVCLNEWDAWIAEDGTLEDKWACACTNGNCKNHGGPAVLCVE